MTARNKTMLSRLLATLALGAAIVALLIGLPGIARADNSNVFDWTDVPQNQVVPVERAAFDAGGYQIYDTTGDTIVVPFTNNNLYVMQFAPSGDGTMHFVNSDGNVPILYVPDGGYLENANVSGARWYPFSPGFHEDHPVFLGIAPSWDAYVAMGWYPGMYSWGGYWDHDGIFVATSGLFFEIGGARYDGWGGYRHYYHDQVYP